MSLRYQVADLRVPHGRATHAPARDRDGRLRETWLERGFCLLSPTVMLMPDHGALGLFRHLLAMTAIVAVMLAAPASTRSLRFPLPLVWVLGWAILSLAWSVDQQASKRRILALLLMTVIGWAAGALLPSERLLPLLARFGRWLVVLVYVEVILFPGWSARSTLDSAAGFRASFQHKNALGMFGWTAFVLVVCERRTHWRRWAAAAAGIVVLSQSSTGVAALATVTGLIAFFGALTTMAPGLRRTVLVTGALFLLLAGSSLAFVDPALLTAVFGRDATFTGRTSIWSAVWDAVQRKPWVGYGFGSIWDNATPTSERLWNATGFRAYHAHQGYLDLTLQFGVVGVAGVAALIGSTFVRSGSALRRMRPDAWMTLIMTGLLITAFAESEPFFNGGWAWIVLVSTAALRLRHTPKP